MEWIRKIMAISQINTSMSLKKLSMVVLLNQHQAIACEFSQSLDLIELDGITRTSVAQVAQTDGG